MNKQEYLLLLWSYHKQLLPQAAHWIGVAVMLTVPCCLCFPPLTGKGFLLHFKHTLRLLFTASAWWEEMGLTHSFRGKSLVTQYASLTNII